MSGRDHQEWLYRGDQGRFEPFSGALESVEGKKNEDLMSGGEYQKWLHTVDKDRDDPYNSLEWGVCGSPDMDELKEEEDSPKDYEAIRSWVEYANTKTWLMEASRVSDKSTTLSTLPREHHVAVPLPKGKMEKWLVPPTADALAGRLQAKLVVSSDNAPWLMSRAPKEDVNAITAHFSAVLSSPSSQWLGKRSSCSDNLAKWLLEPKKPRLSPTSPSDPLSSWKTYQAGVDWIASPCSQEHQPDTDPMNNTSGGNNNPLAFPSVPPASLPFPLSNYHQMGVDIDKWLLPSTSPSFLSPPLCKSVSAVETVSTLDQWLLWSDSLSEPESDSSLHTISSEYELVDELA